MATAIINISAAPIEPLYTEVQLKFSSLYSDVCLLISSDYQLDVASGGVLANASTIYEINNNLAPEGNYSDGVNKVHWDGETISLLAACDIPTPSYEFLFSTSCDSGVGGGALCCAVNTYPQTFFCGDNPILVGSIIYEDAVEGTKFVGANLWHKEQSTGKSYRINSIGEVTGIYTCAAGYSVGISAETFASNSIACATYSEVNSVVYVDSLPITNGHILYNDAPMTEVFNGQGLSYVTSASAVITSVTVDSSGVVTSSANC